MEGVLKTPNASYCIFRAKTTAEIPILFGN
jgi:hypothetical protein